jgi:DNA mismatch repair protein MutS2
VGNEGSIRCVDARHPVLLLRGTEPIGNKIELNQSATALVISGPNAGGKTIVLKTAGLFALMAKHAIPLPAKMGARVDFMQVMADIGDMQSVSGDLSTFSGHLVVCREMLSHAQSYTGHSLVLLDEIGTGTDPAQGAALAQVGVVWSDEWTICVTVRGILIRKFFDLKKGVITLCS